MTIVVTGFAIVRVDRSVTDDEDRVYVERVLWSQELAEAEVLRLNKLNTDKNCFYFWQYTRVDAPVSSGQER